LTAGIARVSNVVLTPSCCSGDGVINRVFDFYLPRDNAAGVSLTGLYALSAAPIDMAATRSMSDRQCRRVH